MPLGVVGGRKDIMNVFSGADGAPAIFAGGTFSGNPATMAAGVAAIETMKANKEEIYPYLIEQGDHIADEINAFCEGENIPAQLVNAGSMLHLFLPRERLNLLMTSIIALSKLNVNFTCICWVTRCWCRAFILRLFAGRTG